MKIPNRIHADPGGSVSSADRIVQAGRECSCLTEESLPELPPRAEFSHKGDYGHLLLVCGSRRMPGAALLATQGALRSGCGLVTTCLPASAATALIAVAPSAMLSPYDADFLSEPSGLPDNLGKYTAIGVGPGLGDKVATANAFHALLRQCHTSGTRMVVDADALNILAVVPGLRPLLPEGSILTPHPGELRRLVGDWADDDEKLELTKALATDTRCIVLVKSARTAIVEPSGHVWFNSTGNPGMAKGGSGDVLTGLIAGLLARGLPSPDAALLGVWHHGAAGDRAAGELGQESMNAGDIPRFIRL